MQAPLPSRLQTRALIACLIVVLSVFRFGLVQVSVTVFPARTAVRSPTGSGKLSDGGWGAPGVPHPGIRVQSASTKMAQAFRSNELIAF